MSKHTDTNTIYGYVSSLIDLGYSTIPGWQTPDGGTAPLATYQDGEIYPADCLVPRKKDGKLYNPWDIANFIGIRLDRLILIDYDGNKGRPALHPQQLAAVLGVETMRNALVQYGLTPEGKMNGSFHFLYKFPDTLPDDYFYKSQDGKFHGIDFKTGNQLIWLKPGKVRNFPLIGDLPRATEPMIKILRKPQEVVNTAPVRIRQAGESQQRGMAWLEASCRSLAECHEGGRNSRLNSTALAAFRHALAGEFDEGLAASMLIDAAQQCGLASGEIKTTMKSARSKAHRAGPKNLLERPRENNSSYGRMSG